MYEITNNSDVDGPSVRILAVSFFLSMTSRELPRTTCVKIDNEIAQRIALLYLPFPVVSILDI